MSFYNISSDDGRDFRVSANAVKHSESFMECISVNKIAANSRAVSEHPVSGAILDRIIPWCEHHKFGNVPNEVTEWDRTHLTAKNRKDRMNLVLAASLLKMKDLKRMSIQLFCEQETTHDTGFIHLQSKDGRAFQMSLQAAKQSLLLAQILENLSGKSPVFPITVDSTSAQLDILVKWCEYHKGEPIPVMDPRQNPFDRTVPQFDKNLLRLGNEEMMKVIGAGAALEINGFVKNATKNWFEKELSVERLSALF
ncbi:unnamed protein product [Caenorhabditis brenneri]